MVELLAAIVVLGILLSLSLSTIFKTIERGRNKTYIADASNMVAQAEYLIKSKPAEIRKPSSIDSCVVIFLSKFNSDDFSTAPNGGTYLPSSSFVIYKKKADSTYEFSGMLIEEMKKGGFKGVQLTKGDDLSKGKGEIVDNTTISSGEVASYINDVWPDYCINGISIIE